jgi:hypothetical protein
LFSSLIVGCERITHPSFATPDTTGHSDSEIIS